MRNRNQVLGFYGFSFFECFRAYIPRRIMAVPDNGHSAGLEKRYTQRSLTVLRGQVARADGACISRLTIGAARRHLSSIPRMTLCLSEDASRTQD